MSFLLHQTAQRFPARTAVRWQNGREILEITYEQLYVWGERSATEINRASDELNPFIDMDIGKKLIAVAFDEGPLLVLSLAVSWLCGAAVMPLATDETAARLRAIVQDARVNMILAPSKHVNHLNKLLSSGTPMQQQIAVVDFEQIAQNIWKHTNHPADKVQAFKCAEDQGVGHVWFTSGSSGIPKGCIVEHKSTISYARARNLAHHIKVYPQARIMLASAPNFDPFLADIVCSWLSAACLCLAPGLQVNNNLGLCLSQSEATHVCTTPSIFETVLIEGWLPAQLCHLETIALGGEQTSEAIINTWARAEGGRVMLLNTYGVTEVTVYQMAVELIPKHLIKDSLPPPTSSSSLSASLSVKSDLNPVAIDSSCCGCPLDGVLVWLLDPVSFAPVKKQSGEVGEIVLGGIQVARGYLRREELSHEKFIERDDSVIGPPLLGEETQEAEEGVREGTAKSKQLLFRTGDLACLHEDGLIYIQGRSDQQMKVHGRRIEAGEVEDSFMKVNDVLNENKVQSCIAKCAAFVTNDVKCSKLAIVIVLTEEAWNGLFLLHKLNETQCDNDLVYIHQNLSFCLRSLCIQVAPAHLTPSVAIFAKSLPLTKSGKLHRLKLPEMLAKAVTFQNMNQQCGPANISSSTTSTDWLSDLVCQVWSTTLALQPDIIDPVSSTFVSLGGDSLLALRASRDLTRILFSISQDVLKKSSINQHSDSNSSSMFGLCSLEKNELSLSKALGQDTGEIKGALNPKQMLFGEIGEGGPTVLQYANKIREQLPHAVLDEYDKQHSLSTKEGRTNNGTQDGFQSIDDPESNDTHSGAYIGVFWRAVMRGEAVLVECLLVLGVSPNATVQDKDPMATIDGQRDQDPPPLESEAAEEQQEHHQYLQVLKARKVVEAGGVGGHRNNVGRKSALLIATCNGSEQVVEVLLRAGAAVRCTDSAGRMPAHAAAAMGFSRVLALLLDHTQTSGGNGGEEAIVRRSTPLLAKDLNKQTLLHCAARSGSEEAVALVIDRWRSELPQFSPKFLDQGDRWHRTPVHWSILNGHLGCLKVLLAQGASPSPPQPSASRHSRRTSLRLETPLELARRLHLETGEGPVSLFEEALISGIK